MAVISTSTPIELTDIRNAIGGTLPKTLRNYISGTGLTPANAIGTNGFLPTSLTSEQFPGGGDFGGGGL